MSLVEFLVYNSNMCGEIITAIDFETTGTVAGFRNEPWQIGLAEISPAGITKSRCFGSYLKISAERPFNIYAPGRYAQVREILADSPTLVDLWPKLSTAITGIYLAAHNIGTEKSILTGTFPMHRFGPWIDTLVLARKAWPGLASYALEDLIPRLSLSASVTSLCPGLEPHDALYDAVACGVLLLRVRSLPGWDKLSLEDLVSLR